MAKMLDSEAGDKVTSMTCNVTLKAPGANEFAGRLSAIAVLHAKVGGLYEDIAEEMRALAKMGDIHAGRTDDAPTTAETNGKPATESAP